MTRPPGGGQGSCPDASRASWSVVGSVDGDLAPERVADDSVDPVEDIASVGSVVVANAATARIRDAPRGHRDDLVAGWRPEHRTARVAAARSGAVIAVAFGLDR